MDKYEYSKEGDKCTYGLAVMKSCRECLFKTLCSLEKGKAILDQKKITEKNS